jgi:membrane-associated phospholipid phosphatase
MLRFRKQKHQKAFDMQNTIPEKAHLSRYIRIMLVGYLIWGGAYFFTAWIGALRGPALDVALPIDARIPFLPCFQPFYLLCYVVPAGIFLISRAPRFLNRAFMTFIAANVFSFLFFIAIPVQGPPRGEILTPDASLWTTFIYLLDSRYNAFPSLHVANACMLALLAWTELGFTLKTALFVMLAVLICVSTLFVRQHYLLDVAGGMLVAVVSVGGLSQVRISERPWGRR